MYMIAVARLIKAKTISFTEEILSHYKKLNLTEQEAIILVFLYRKLDTKNNVLSINDLVDKMTLNEDLISSLVIGLVQKGYIDINMEDGVESFLLDGVYEALAKVLDEDENRASFSSRQDLLSQIVLYIETTYAKTLSPADLMIINNWIDLGYSYNEIKKAVLDSLKAKKMHLRYADAILANRKKVRSTDTVECDDEIREMLNSMYVK